MKGTGGRLAAFTLVELLTVVAIIALLMSILLPTLHKARQHARRVRVQAQLRTMGTGCEYFREDLQRYPRSCAGSPFEAPPSEPPSEKYHLQGAQALFMELAGVDTLGLVSERIDTNGDHVIDWNDQRAWYTRESGFSVPRYGPYLRVDPQDFTTPHDFVRSHPQARPAANVLGEEDGGIGGVSNWNNGRIPFFADAFGFPILYYRAETTRQFPVSTSCPENSTWVPGVYDHSDNAGITGFAQPNGAVCYDLPFEGWDLPDRGHKAGELVHPLGVLGYSADTPEATPPRGSFADVVHGPPLPVQSGVKRPLRNRDTFVLLSPGPDGLYGTRDDIDNFGG